MEIKIENKVFEVKGKNLYLRENKYYRLFAQSVSPNLCWLDSPVMQELIDIDTATGNDVYGSKRTIFEMCGTVPRHLEFITTKHVPEFVKAFEYKYPSERRLGWKTIPGIPVELI